MVKLWPHNRSRAGACIEGLSRAINQVIEGHQERQAARQALARLATRADIVEAEIRAAQRARRWWCRWSTKIGSKK
jgi:hypothetical protein